LLPWEVALWGRSCQLHKAVSFCRREFRSGKEFGLRKGIRDDSASLTIAFR
jgi:hypothetical protein